jgi:hypothetical protein
MKTFKDYLKNNYLYKITYNENGEEYFCYVYKTKNSEKIINSITNEEFNIEKALVIEIVRNYAEYRYFYKIYSRYKDNSIFKIKDIEKQIQNISYLPILRFFNLTDWSLIFEKNPERDLLDSVIKKLQIYYGRYFGFIESIEYSKQLKHAESIYEILTFIPKEFYEKNKHFWINILKEQYKEQHTTIYSFTIKDIKDYNHYRLNLFENYKDNDSLKSKVMYQIKWIETSQKENFINKCASKILDRIKEANITLDNEYETALKLNDEDLIFEINVIKEELNKIQNDIFNINFFTDVVEWWPELLYPIPTNIDYFTPELKDIDKLYQLKYVCCVML